MQLDRGSAPVTPLKGVRILKQRNNGIIIRLNDKELARLNAMVAKTKMNREAFIRTVLAGYQIKEWTADLHALFLEVRRIGINVDQLLKIARAKGWLSVRELEKLREETDQVNHKIVEALVPSKEKGGCQTWMRSAP